MKNAKTGLLFCQRFDVGLVLTQCVCTDRGEWGWWCRHLCSLSHKQIWVCFRCSILWQLPSPAMSIFSIARFYPHFRATRSFVHHPIHSSNDLSIGIYPFILPSFLPAGHKIPRSRPFHVSTCFVQSCLFTFTEPPIVFCISIEFLCSYSLLRQRLLISSRPTFQMPTCIAEVCTGNRL